MRKKILIILAVIILVAIVIGWLVFGSATKFNEKSKYIYVREGRDTKEQVISQLTQQNIIRNTGLFSLVASQLNVWERLNPGKFEIQKGESIFSIAHKLRNNTQTPVKFVINKIRTREDLAKLIGKNFVEDSATAIQFLNNNDSLMQFGVDTNSFSEIIIPNTYLFNWNTPVRNILHKLKNEDSVFWSKNNRMQLAQQQGLSPQQVYIIASIVEEETIENGEKGNIASVYINRLNKGMALGADPTIKFALKDFALKRILDVHTHVNSPFNTYINKGLPPGAICTPSTATIDAVLNAPATDYLFFVAKSDFSGYHHFSNNFAEHIQYAKEYQKALTELLQRKQNQNK